MQHKQTVQYSDQRHCKDCGQTWDMNDPHPPECQAGLNSGREAEYRVTWDIDVTADSPEDAVRQVWENYFRHDHTATVFEVRQFDEPDSELIDVESPL